MTASEISLTSRRGKKNLGRTRARATYDNGRRARADSLSGTLRFFERLSANTSRLYPDTFVELWLREVVRLLERVHLGWRVDETGWRNALADIRTIRRQEAGADR